MKERPILFRPELVRKILDGEKTMTRRIMKPQPEHGIGCITIDGQPGEHEWSYLDEEGDAIDVELRCPFGIRGDRLWVRETWCGHWGPTRSGGRMISGVQVSQSNGSVATATVANPVTIFYRADWDEKPYRHSEWRPSIFMPRWASRLTLEITEVRVERLQEIDGDEARAEGCMDVFDFAMRWDEINGKAHSWGSNPFVWVVEFKPIEVSDVR